VIIINLPTNDAASAFTVQESQDNLNRVVALADAANVPVFVATTQPRDNMSAGGMLMSHSTIETGLIQGLATKQLTFGVQ
jgi:hypothetical protein